MSKIALFVLLVLASVLGSLFLFGGGLAAWIWAANSEGYRARFLLTVSVEVDGEVMTAHSVYETSYNNVLNASVGGGGIYRGARGTMPYIDMGEYGTVVLNFYSTPSAYLENSNILPGPNRCIESSAGALPTRVLVADDVKLSSGRAYVQAMMEAKGQFSVGRRSIPAYWIPKDKTIFEAKGFYFCDLSLILGENVKPRPMTLEHTELPLETSISNPPDWLIRWRESKENGELKKRFKWAGSKYTGPPIPRSIEREKFYR